MAERTAEEMEEIWEQENEKERKSREEKERTKEEKERLAEEEKELRKKTKAADIEATEKIKRQKKIDADIQDVRERQEAEERYEQSKKRGTTAEDFRKMAAKNAKKEPSQPRKTFEVEEGTGAIGEGIATVKGFAKDIVQNPREYAGKAQSALDKLASGDFGENIGFFGAGLKSTSDKMRLDRGGTRNPKTGEVSGGGGIFPMGSGGRQKYSGSGKKQTKAPAGKTPAITKPFSKSMFRMPSFGGGLQFPAGRQQGVVKQNQNMPSATKGNPYNLGMNFGSVFSQKKKTR